MKVLLIGHCCIDAISHVRRYPAEDSTVGSLTTHNQCTKQLWERGGNASNNSSVLAALGAEVEFLGVLANDHFLAFFQNDMKSRGINFDNCPVHNGRESPNSVVICSEETGSRTIIHHNGTLPELQFHEFKDQIQLDNYSWVHFEGRNPEQVLQMLKHVKSENDRLGLKPGSSRDQPLYLRKLTPVSVEIEKARYPLRDLLPHADVVFIGRDFATLHGAGNSQDGVKAICPYVQTGCLIICPWGETGASFGIKPAEGETIEVKSVLAFKPEKIVDSLGAGDTFDAAVVYALNAGRSLEESVEFGCRIAGSKLQFHGFRDISSLPKF